MNERFRKAFGQHFLTDTAVSHHIVHTFVDHLKKSTAKSVLEIGPGQGALTRELLTSLKTIPVTLVEKDFNLTPKLTAEFQDRENLKIIRSDFLDIEIDTLLTDPPLAVISNLPYSVGTAIVDRLCRQIDRVEFMVLMFQAEVAQRLSAKRGTKAWGSLSIWIQNQWDVQSVLKVPPKAFSPPPKVNSEVVLLTRRSSPRLSVPLNQPHLLEKILKTCFAHRRKMLRSGLPNTGAVRNGFELSGLDGTQRAEQLDWNDWQKLIDAVISAGAVKGE